MASLRILVVEDNPVNQQIVTAVLEKGGHHITLASNGASAVSAVTTAVFDLILMDCQMSEMDGYECTRRIRSMGGSFTHLPIIALTANVFEENRDKCLSCGMNDFLTKPVDAGVLLRTIERWVGGSSVTSIIDRSALESLRALEVPGKPGVVKTLVEMFMTTSAEQLAGMEIAAQNNDFKTVSRLAHSLKSSASYLGARDLAKTCLKLEKLADGSTAVSEVPDLLKQIFMDRVTAIEELQTMMQATAN